MDILSFERGSYYAFYVKKFSTDKVLLKDSQARIEIYGSDSASPIYRFEVPKEGNGG
jgi:hypothetical protein